MFDDHAIRTAAREVVSEIIGRSIGDNQPLISSGLIDSLSVLKLIGKLEVKLQIEIPTDGLQPDDFDDIELIVDTLRRVAKSAAV